MDILGIINLPAWLVLTLVIVLLIYVYSTWTFDHFTKMGIPGPKPYPYVGNLLQLLFKFPDMRDYDKDLINTYGKIIGIFERRTPVLVVADPDIIKQVMVKEFHNFTNREGIVKEDDKIFKVMLTNLRDDHWKHVRNLMTPSFTTGKLKKMHHHLNKVADILVENLTEKAGEKIDVKDHASAFTFDAIARTAFGLELNTQKDPDNPFIKHAKAIMVPNNFVMLVLFVFPFLFKVLQKVCPGLMAQTSRDFFSEMGSKMMEERIKQNMEHADFMQMLMNAHVELPEKEDMKDEELTAHISHDELGAWSKKGLTKEEIIGNLVLFFLAGMETTASTMTLVLYYLAINPEVMQRVIEEVDEVVGTKDTITPDMTSKLNYMEQCVMETLRINSLAFRTNRSANNAINLGGITIPKGQRVDIPIHALHHDSDVYPEPEKFDPDRFTPEARAARNPIYWMPFGYGPRNCIGLRLAMVELKLCLAKVFQKLTLKTCDETDIPLEMKLGRPKKPIKLQVETRVN